jgi:hypothetical protein
MPSPTPPTCADTPDVADCRSLSLAPGRTLHTRVAGIFLFLPLLARVGFDRIVAAAGYPESHMVPAHSALLSLLALKLLDKERRSHITDFNFDEALGLFAGLNILPKKTFANDYSFRTHRRQQQSFLAGWIGQLSTLLFPDADTFCLDFHAIPYRGDPSGLDNHYLPMRGKAGPSVLTFFAHEQKSRVFCYANANLTRQDQVGEPLRFVEFWHDLTGHDPQWLYFDSKLVGYRELAQLNQRGISFITIRRRGSAILRRLQQLPSSTWRSAHLDIPKRLHKNVRYVDERITLPGYEGSLRQVAVAGLGRERFTLFASNNFDITARDLILRYAGRNAVEDSLGISVNFFHLDCLASAVRLNVDVDVALTVVANGCYRWLAKRLHGFDKAKPKELYRKFVETGGHIEVRAEELVVHFDKRSHSPILREAALDQPGQPIPWLGDRRIIFTYS